MSFEDQIRTNIGRLPHDRIKVSRFNEIELTMIAQYVLFVFATWSGDAAVSLRLLCEALSASPESRFPVIVIDAEGFDFDAFKRSFGELPQGKGEAFWIKGGQIVFRDNGYTADAKDVLQARIQSLNSSEGGSLQECLKEYSNSAQSKCDKRGAICAPML
jgi:hypothetical protein